MTLRYKDLRIEAMPDLYAALDSALIQMRIWVYNHGDMVGALQEIIDQGEAALQKARGLDEAPNFIVIHPKDDPMTGKRYEDGDWSRRNYEAWIEDHLACAALQARLDAFDAAKSRPKAR